MANDQPPKKIRLLDAGATLTKPFKSPLRTRDSSKDLLCQPPLLTSYQTNTAHIEERTVSSQIAEDNVEHGKQLLRSLQGTPKRQPSRLRLAAPSKSPLADSELLELQKKKRVLQAHLKSLTDELENTKQAIQIESSGKDAELETLTRKWRHIAQQAAEEVLGGAQERISRMGGMAAWRERSRRDSMRWEFEDDVHGRGSDGDEEVNATNETTEANGSTQPQPNEEEQEEVSFFVSLFALKSMLINSGIKHGVHAKDL